MQGRRQRWITASKFFLPARPLCWEHGQDTQPQSALALQQMGGFGGGLTFEVSGGPTAAEAVLASLRLSHRSASFGSFSMLAVHPAAMWAGMLTEEQLSEADLPLGLIRLGVGFEDPNALIKDPVAAFAKLLG